MVSRTLKEMVIVVLGIISAIYLINPTAGVFELIPDVVPIIGNLDEAAAVGILINTFRYYGWDMTNLYGSRKKVKTVRRIVSDTGEVVEEQS